MFSLGHSIPSVAVRGGLAPWWRRPTHLVDGFAPGAAADFVRGRYMLADRAGAFGDLIALTSEAKWIVDTSGALVQVSAGQPAFDGSTGRRRWLLEGAATNLVPNAWSPSALPYLGGITVATGAAVGGASEILVTETSTTAQHYGSGASTTFTAGSSYVASVIARALTGRFLQLAFPSAAFGATQYATFDLVDGAVVASAGAGTAYITALPGGRHLCEWAMTAVATATAASFIAGLATSGSAGRLPAYAGDGRAVALLCVQTEVGSRATSRISTAGAAVTRVADLAALQPAAAAVLQGAGAAVVWRGAAGSSVASQHLLSVPSGALIGQNGAGGISLYGSTDMTGLAAPNSTLPGEVGFCGGFGPTGKIVASRGAAAVTAATLVDRARTAAAIGPPTGLAAGQVLALDELVCWLLADRPSAAAVQDQARVWA